MQNPFTLLFIRRKVVRRDYASPTTRHADNPLFKTDMKRRFPWIILLITSTLIGGSAYTALTPKYRITTITVTGTIKVDQTSVTQFVNGRLNEGLLGLQWRRVTYLTPTKQIERDLRRSIERLLSVNALTIERVGLHELHITVSERTPNTVWQTPAGTKYLIDEKGIVVERLSDEVPEGFHTLVDANGIDTTIGATVIRPEYLAALTRARDALEEVGVKPVSFKTWEVKCRTIIDPLEIRSNTNSNDYESAPTYGVVPEGNTDTNDSESVNRANTDEEDCNEQQLAMDDPTMVITSDEGWEVRIDTTKDITSQVKKLQMTLDQKFKSSRSGLRYVDVRFGDRVYYK